MSIEIYKSLVELVSLYLILMLHYKFQDSIIRYRLNNYFALRFSQW